MYIVQIIANVLLIPILLIGTLIMYYILKDIRDRDAQK